MATEPQTRTDLIESKIDRDTAGAIALTSLGARFGTMMEIMEFAKMMATAGPAIRPVFRNNPGACLRVAIQANHFGFEPFSFASKCYFVNDELAYEAQLIHAIILAHGPFTKRPTVTYSGEGDKRKCKVILHLVDPDGDKDYESPEKAKITPQNSPLWKSDPDQQLNYYSMRAAARRHIPDVILGMYDMEEMAAATARDITPAKPSISDTLKSSDKVEIVYTSAKPAPAASAPVKAAEAPAGQPTAETGEAAQTQVEAPQTTSEPQRGDVEDRWPNVTDMFEKGALQELTDALAKVTDTAALAVVEDEFNGTITMASAEGGKEMRALMATKAEELKAG